jgi:hypothetical protein
MATRQRQTYVLAVLSDGQATEHDGFRCRITHVASGEHTLLNSREALLTYLSTRGVTEADVLAQTEQPPSRSA